MVLNFDQPFEEMMFGGTEKEIIERGTDWCTDITRVGSALLQCLGIPCRMVSLVNTKKAYHGHQVCEAIMDQSFLLCDFTYGVVGYIDKPYSVNDIINNPLLIKTIYADVSEKEDFFDYVTGLFDRAAISDYDVTEKHCYRISHANQYYLDMMRINHQGNWCMGEMNE